MKETIEWFDYPDVKPKKDGKHLCKVNYLDIGASEVIESDYYHREFLTSGGSDLEDFGVIIMWANMPRGVSNDK